MKLFYGLHYQWFNEVLHLYRFIILQYHSLHISSILLVYLTLKLGMGYKGMKMQRKK